MFETPDYWRSKNYFANGTESYNKYFSQTEFFLQKYEFIVIKNLFLQDDINRHTHTFIC